MVTSTENRTETGPAVLATKFYAPPPLPAPGVVNRAELLDRLETRLNRRARLTLVCAPAGFGKTTLVAEWLHRAGHRFSWLSLDEGDNDPVRFLTYLVAALQRIDETIGQGLLQRPEGGWPPVESLVTMLVNDLVAMPEPFVLVLDDYHLIQAPLIYELMDRLWWPIYPPR